MRIGLFHPIQRLGLVLALFSASAVAWVRAADEPAVVPRPMIVEAGQGALRLTENSVIRTTSVSGDLFAVGRLLRNGLEKECGLRVGLDETKAGGSTVGEIRLALIPERRDLGQEGYELAVSPEGVVIQAATRAGVFWGTQTLLQLVAVASKGDQPSATKAVDLPAVRIVDRPRFGWRGLMLDCSRTFLPIEFLRKYVDLCAFYKMNVLHLHLTDDQGWRPAIRKHPRLTEVGSQFDGRFPGEVSGYYTREQMKDLVQYAAERCVTIVPEIEMPAHCLALLAAYPQLSCREPKNKYVIAPYMFMSDPDPQKEPRTPYGALCPGNDGTFQLVEDILQDIIEIFPGEYIHLAGDECPKGFWKECPKCQARVTAEGLKDEEELQSYFVRRVAKMIQARGRKVIGWDEILEGGLAPGAAIMSWRSTEAGITAAKMGHPVVMASKSHLYFDYCYNRTPASLVYAFEPVPSELSPEQRPLVLGVQACMWTHLARTEQAIDMSIFPRALALAEVGWTPADRREWGDFEARMKLHEPILAAKGVHCFVRNEGPLLPNLSAGQDGRLWLVNAKGEIHLRKGERWERFPGQARQVTSGPDGTIWSVSTKPAKRGYTLMRWLHGQWRPLGDDVAAVQIAAAPDGSLWTVTEAYAIWRYANDKWANVQGLAREVTAGRDGTVWILTADPAPGGYQLYAAPPGGRWRRVQPLMAGVHIAAGPALWVTRDDGSLLCIADGTWQPRPGDVSSLTVGVDGTVWALSGAGDGLLNWTGRGWRQVNQP